MSRGSVSVTVGSSAKFAAEVVAILLSFGTGILTARHLGPDGKGQLATLGYLSVLMGSAATIGLGDAATILVSRATSGLERALTASLGLLAMSTPLAAVILVAVGLALSGHQPGSELNAALLASAAVPFVASSAVLEGLVDARQHFLVTSGARAAMALVTLVGTAVALLAFNGGVTAALTAALVGWTVPLLICAVWLRRRMAVRFRPRWDLGYAREALRLGLPIQLSWLLMAAGARLDVLFVLGVRGDAAAGLYSVAVTVGSLASFAPFALVTAAYPRVAGLPEEEALDLTQRVCRAGTVLSIGAALAVAVAVPTVVPLTFGTGFRDAVPVCLVLAAAAVPWSVQWAVTRAAAARGRTGLAVAAFGTSVAVMLLLDAALVPPYGPMGAAVASLLSSVTGAAVAIAGSRRQFPAGVLAALLPRFRDVTELVRLARNLLRPAMIG